MCIGRPSGEAEIVVIDKDELKAQEQKFLQRLAQYQAQLNQAVEAA